MIQLLLLIPICLLATVLVGAMHLYDIEELPAYGAYNGMYLLFISVLLLFLVYFVTPG